MSKVKQYRKKPVVIEAIVVTKNNYDQICEFVDDTQLDAGWLEIDEILDTVEIQTLEGIMTAQVGDYIIKGVAGEFYPCKPDIFKATYEEVAPPQEATRKEIRDNVYNNPTYHTQPAPTPPQEAQE